ncbi:1230_t:CDS:2 [Funneliformis caledonium]|uniref:1230_t:CDS:1 n=1 Tax=Funneliformis caledonium TaxID=1117310 RepID=A0A9N9IIL2_9GLOM|nr:1230_t:CDS:2 [Funneliformis caledonium]
MSKEFTSRHPNREQSTILMATKTTKIRSKVRCNCKKYNNNWVDSRTHNKYYAFYISKISTSYSTSLQQKNFSADIQIFDYDLALSMNSSRINQNKESEQSSCLTNNEENVFYLDVDKLLMDDIKQILNDDNDTPDKQYTPFDHNDIDTDSDLKYSEINIKFDKLWILP